MGVAWSVAEVGKLEEHGEPSCIYSPVPSLSSTNEVLIIAVKNYAKEDMEISGSGPCWPISSILFKL